MFVQLLSPCVYLLFFLIFLFISVFFTYLSLFHVSFILSRFLVELLNMNRDEEGIPTWGDSKHLRGPCLRLMKDGWWPLGLPRLGNGNQRATTLVISGCHLWDTNKARQSGGVLQLRPVLLADRSPKVEKPNPQMLADWFSTFFAGWWWWWCWWWWRWTWKWWGYIEPVIFAWFRPRSHASRAPSFQRGRNLIPHGLKAGLGRFFAFWST